MVLLSYLLLRVTICVLKKCVVEGTHSRMDPGKFVISFVAAVYEMSILTFVLINAANC